MYLDQPDCTPTTYTPRLVNGASSTPQWEPWVTHSMNTCSRLTLILPGIFRDRIINDKLMYIQNFPIYRLILIILMQRLDTTSSEPTNKIIWLLNFDCQCNLQYNFHSLPTCSFNHIFGGVYSILNKACPSAHKQK